MKTLSYKTESVKPADIERTWYHVDATDQVVGRLASKIASVLRGKHQPFFTPHIDCGDYIVVTNVDRIRFTGNKLNDKEYQRYSGYPGGQKSETAREMQKKKPFFLLENAVRGMLPKNKLGRQMIKKLFLYEGDNHPHQAQKPQPFNF